MKSQKYYYKDLIDLCHWAIENQINNQIIYNLCVDYIYGTCSDKNKDKLLDYFNTDH